MELSAGKAPAKVANPSRYVLVIDVSKSMDGNVESENPETLLDRVKVWSLWLRSRVGYFIANLKSHRSSVHNTMTWQKFRFLQGLWFRTHLRRILYLSWHFQMTYRWMFQWRSWTKKERWVSMSGYMFRTCLALKIHRFVHPRRLEVPLVESGFEYNYSSTCSWLHSFIAIFPKL